jgi:hypothetical protein
MQDDHKTCEPAEPDEGESPAGEPIRRQRLTIGARATLLLGLSMGAIAAVSVVSPVFSRTVSKP